MKLSTLNTLKVEVEKSIAVVTINRPDNLNAFSPEVMVELNSALDDIENDHSIKVVVITGSGEKAFVVGNDLSQLAQLDTADAYEQMREGQKIFLRIHEFCKPVIAMVNGYALGGGFELALSCDFIVAPENAKFGFPEINLNTMPGWGGTQLAVKKMGFNQAKEMVLTGQYYTAAECKEFGFINRIVPKEKLRKITLDLANVLSSKQSFSMKMAKESLNRGLELDLANGCRFEAQAYSVNFSTPHAKEGFEDFLNRNKKKSR